MADPNHCPQHSMTFIADDCRMGTVREGGHCTTPKSPRSHQATPSKVAPWKVGLGESSHVRSQALPMQIQI